MSDYDFVRGWKEGEANMSPELSKAFDAGKREGAVGELKALLEKESVWDNEHEEYVLRITKEYIEGRLKTLEGKGLEKCK